MWVEKNCYLDIIDDETMDGRDGDDVKERNHERAADSGAYQRGCGKLWDNRMLTIPVSVKTADTQRM